ncbi:protein of unknown function [Microbacterium sp. Nx66]|uniref:Lsr2 family DNA-binding protein n=1 Tax=Microbacterium sp. Nx66 TaxID=2766784 RepID=UPI0016574DF5|nr:Lsr2 family protein [Microbacterium sp. Nx66]CAD5141151.1 protein of unknown function [Microbacterium sp. Nx66]
MSALETKLNPGAVRAWARANGIPVSKTGKIALHVRECYAEAHPQYVAEPDTELQARSSRPDLFALADDVVEAEMVRTGRLSFEPPANEPRREEPRSLTEWLRLRDELADAIAQHVGGSPSVREAAEALLVQGWMRNAAA